MKLNELSPATGSVREAYRKGLSLIHISEPTRP